MLGLLAAVITFNGPMHTRVSALQSSLKFDSQKHQGSTLIFLPARQLGLLLPDAAGPDQMFSGSDQLFVSEVRKCIITWFSLADTKQFQSHFTLNIY